MLVKICGTTSVAEAVLAARAGADFLGVIIDHPRSPRNIGLEDSIAIREVLRSNNLSTPLVAVTVNLPFTRLVEIYELLQPYALQLHGDESPELVSQLVRHGVKVWATCGEGENASQRASTLQAAGAEAVLVDARAKAPNGEMIYGGTGKISNWSLAHELVQSGARVVLCGGLNPQNVHNAIAEVQPWIVDVISGVEARPGTKDAEKVRAFIATSRSAAS